MDWASKEMGAANLGDAGLNTRLIMLLGNLGNNAQASIPVACGGWAETKAAYRFFDNPHVNAEKVLAPHKATTIDRIKQQKTILLIQDTTTLNFSGQHKREIPVAVCDYFLFFKFIKFNRVTSRKFFWISAYGFVNSFSFYTI
jgi:hypothetical protein